MHSPHDVPINFLIAPFGMSVLNRCHDHVSGLPKHSLTDQKSFERRLLPKNLRHVIADDFDVIEVVHVFAATYLVKTQIAGWTFLSDCESTRKNVLPPPVCNIAVGDKVATITQMTGSTATRSDAKGRVTEPKETTESRTDGWIKIPSHFSKKP